MKYVPEQRLEIGKKLFDGDISFADAGKVYGITPTTLRNYLLLYRNTLNLPNTQQNRSVTNVLDPPSFPLPDDFEHFNSLSKNQLVRELILSKINEARLKKGYVVKGGGATKKVFCPLEKESTR